MVWFDDKGSTIDISSESLCSKGNSEHLSFDVGIIVLSFGEGFAGKGNRFVVLQKHCTKAYLWGINLYGHGKWRTKVPEDGVTDDSVIDMLEGGIVGAVPGEVCVLLEQLMQRGSQGEQAWDEGTEVCYHA